MINKQLTTQLDALYIKYNRSEYIGSDPLMFVFDYESVGDMEVVGLLASCLAYGRVVQIQASVRRLLGVMGASPREFVLNFTKKDRKLFADFKHRFNDGTDMILLIEAMRAMLKKFGTIENCMLSYYNPDDENILPAMSGFCEYLFSHINTNPLLPQAKAVKYLLSSPTGGSPCKRLNMFLRWVVRDDEVDSGIWKSIPASKLIVPMDTHLARLSRIIGFHNKKTVNLKTAVEVTRRFAEICPNDPVKYDFCLSRVGIVESCNGVSCDYCKNCQLWGFCKSRIDNNVKERKNEF